MVVFSFMRNPLSPSLAHIFIIHSHVVSYLEMYLKSNGNKQKYEISISHSRKVEILLFLANMIVFFFKYHKIYKIQMSKLGFGVEHISHTHVHECWEKIEESM